MRCAAAQVVVPTAEDVVQQSARMQSCAKGTRRPSAVVWKHLAWSACSPRDPELVLGLGVLALLHLHRCLLLELGVLALLHRYRCLVLGRGILALLHPYRCLLLGRDILALLHLDRSLLLGRGILALPHLYRCHLQPSLEGTLDCCAVWTVAPAV